MCLTLNTFKYCVTNGCAHAQTTCSCALYCINMNYSLRFYSFSYIPHICTLRETLKTVQKMNRAVSARFIAQSYFLRIKFGLSVYHIPRPTGDGFLLGSVAKCHFPLSHPASCRPTLTIKKNLKLYLKKERKE